VPTSFDLRFKVAGVDLTAAGTEAIADMHLAGDGPPVSAEDEAKISAKLLGAGPLVIDIPVLTYPRAAARSRFRGPDSLSRCSGRRQGHRNDCLSCAQLRPDYRGGVESSRRPRGEKKLIPVIAMVKGLAKIDPDGVMTWVCEIGDDRILKVNGMSLGVNGALLGKVPY
jgi:hypothetical protein